MNIVHLSYREVGIRLQNCLAFEEDMPCMVMRNMHEGNVSIIDCLADIHISVI